MEFRLQAIAILLQANSTPHRACVNTCHTCKFSRVHVAQVLEPRSGQERLSCSSVFLEVIPSHPCFTALCSTHSCLRTSLHRFLHLHLVLAATPSFLCPSENPSTGSKGADVAKTNGKLRDLRNGRRGDQAHGLSKMDALHDATNAFASTTTTRLPGDYPQARGTVRSHLSRPLPPEAGETRASTPGRQWARTATPHHG